jgi:hypothetical protein
MDACHHDVVYVANCDRDSRDSRGFSMRDNITRRISVLLIVTFNSKTVSALGKWQVFTKREQYCNECYRVTNIDPFDQYISKTSTTFIEL